MSWQKQVVCLAAAGVVLVLSIGGTGQEGKPATRAGFATRPVIASSRTWGFPSVVAYDQRLAELEALGLKIEASRGKNWKFPREVVSVCLQLADTGGRGWQLSAARAARVLERTDDLPLEQQYILAILAGNCTGADGRPMYKGAAYATWRRQRAIFLLEVWQRMEKTIDKNWDPKDIPGPLGGPGGMEMPASPEEIADPKLRAEYEAAIKAYSEKMQRYSVQYHARIFRDSNSEQIKRSFFHLYKIEPDGTDELKEFLNKYMSDLVDAKDLDEIVQAVKDKKLPASLDRPITTLPTPPASAQASPPG